MKETVRAYHLDAAAYAEAAPAVPDSVRAALEGLARRLGPGARVLEIGSASGRDALLMEQLGLVVRLPRHFTYWRAPALAEVVVTAGWSDVDVRVGRPGHRGETWLELSAVRDGVSA